MLSETKNETKKVKTAAAGKKPAAAKRTEMQSVVYVGPSIYGVVQTNTIFQNGLSEVMKKKVAEIPVLKELLVPTGSLGKARKDLREKGSAIHACYHAAVAELAKKEGGNEC